MTNFFSFCAKKAAFLAGVFGGSKMLHSLYSKSGYIIKEHLTHICLVSLV